MVHPPPVLLSGPAARHCLEHMGPHRSHCNISLWLVRFYNSQECAMKKYHLFSCQSLTDLHVTYMKLEFGELDGSSLIALKYFLILPDRILPSHTFQLESPFSSEIKFCKRADHIAWWPCWPNDIYNIYTIIMIMIN